MVFPSPCPRSRNAIPLRERWRPLRHEAPDELGNLIRGGIEREMPRVEDMDFGRRHVATIGLPFRQLERQAVLAPEREQARLRLPHPGLPLGAGVDVRALVVEQVASKVGPAGPAAKSTL